MSKRLAPQVDAIMEIKLESTTAHLWLEEMLTGDRSNNIDNVLERLDSAKWYARAMLFGGENMNGIYYAIEDKLLREMVAEMLDGITKLQQNAVKRYKYHKTSRAGSVTDKEFDAVFTRFLSKADEVEDVLQNHIAKKMEQYLMMGIILAVISFTLGIVVFSLIYKYQKRGHEQLQKIYFQNTQLKKYSRKERQAKKEALTTVRKLTSAVEQSPVSIIITDINADIEYVNPRFLENTGYTLNEVLGKNPRLLNSGETPPATYRHLWQNITSGTSWRGQFHNRKKDGTLYWDSVIISPIRDEAGVITHYLGVQEDITDQKQKEEQLIRQSFNDILTGLPNRPHYFSRLQHEIKRALRNKTKLAILFIDIDNFKSINDAYGHHMGDELLVQVSERLLKQARSIDTVARLGGDEFGIIISDVININMIEKIVSRLMGVFTEPFNLYVNRVRVTLSVGISIYPDNTTDFDELLAKADTAMSDVKKRGRNHYRYFSQEMNAYVQKYNEYLTSLKTALDNGEFNLVYQPIVDILDQNKWTSCEALLRWRSPKHGYIQPTDFINIVEDSGMIIAIGDWILEQAAADLKKIREKLGYDLRMSVNISTRQLQSGDLRHTIENILKKYKLKSDSLILELTENILLDGRSEVTRQIELINELGVNFSIDDFGTGYSSLAYLVRYPFGSLKIDRAFMQDFQNDNKITHLVDAILDIASHLNLRIIAEGVETKEQVEFLHSRGCHLIQGFYFHKPMDLDDILNVIQSGALAFLPHN